jgi:DNA-directed RNA polymerase subunit RPC12/RpoP
MTLHGRENGTAVIVDAFEAGDKMMTPAEAVLRPEKTATLAVEPSAAATVVADRRPALECGKCGCRHLDFIEARKTGSTLTRSLECHNCGARVTERLDLGKSTETARGIVCGYCGGSSWHVRDTDPMEGAIRRYRTCVTCGRVKPTIER